MRKKQVFGFPTPDSIPDESHCRRLRIPDSEQWLSVVMGAIYALTQEDSWQKVGSLTPAEAAEKALEIFSAAYEPAQNNCATYVTPAGTKVIRVNPSGGRVQEQGDDGDWQEPTGDYAIPPVPEREGGTPQDQICLAAANAVNVYSIMYENITDALSEGASDTEAWALAVAAFIELVGVEFAPITTALAVFFLTVILVLVEVIKFIGADLWDEAFTNAFICILVGCASNDAGVVTFDYDCVINALAAQTNVLDLTASQIRLFGQLSYLLQVTGGADGLNQAGATTAITFYDCSGCASGWCYHWGSDDLQPGGADFINDWTIYSVYGSIEDNTLKVFQIDEDSYSLIALLDVFSANVTSFTVVLDWDGGTIEEGVDVVAWGVFDGGTFFGQAQQNVEADKHEYVFEFTSDFDPYPNVIYINPNGGTLTNVRVTGFYIAGDGNTNPFGDTNCV